MEGVGTVASQAIAVVGDVISGLFSTLGTSAVSLFDTLILTDGKLTTFATYTFIFLGVGFVTWIFRKLLRKA